MLAQTVTNLEKSGSFNNKAYNPLNTLRTYSDRHEGGFMNKRTMKGSRFQSFSGPSEIEKRLGSTYTDFNVKPKILESKISQHRDFFNLSDGFKRIFATDRKEQKMVIPIAGYGGHRRGDRSQNFFGKSFRETSLQSKKLQRDLSNPTSPGR